MNKLGPKPSSSRSLVGHTFGKLTVIGLITEHHRPSLSRWLCHCFCGKQSQVVTTYLTTGKTISCGCLRGKLNNLTGQRYGKLIVLSRAENSKKQTRWLCRCDCGNKSVVFYSALVNGLSRSCGCRQGNFIHGLSGKPGYKKFLHKDPAKKIRHNVGILVKNCLKSKGTSKKGFSAFVFLPYTPNQLKKHLESLWEPWMNWDNYGGRADNPEKTWQLDHIQPHSNFKYTSVSDSEFLECWSLSNLRPLEKIENMKKGAKLSTVA